MKENNLPGLSAIWLIGLALVLGTTITVLIPVTFAGDKLTPAGWLGFAGSVLGGSITMFGLFIATRNVNRQLRINLISREEERIEEQLPGLNQVRDELSRFKEETETDGVEVLRDLAHFRQFDDLSDLEPNQRQIQHRAELSRDDWSITAESVEGRLPLADPVLRSRVLSLLLSLKSSADAVDAWETSTLSDKERFNRELERVRAFVQDIEQRIILYERRLTTFRAELEQHFNR